MLHFVQGDMFATHYDALVNAVNCVGVMGKGLALQFRQKYPSNYEAYQIACKQKAMKPGIILKYQENNVIILNAATKFHWKNQSKKEWVIKCIQSLAFVLQTTPTIHTVAVPKLGCGLGGLDWNEIRPIMESELSNCTQDIYIFGEKE